MSDRDRVALTRPQWSIYSAGWRGETRFRVAVCGRRFGKSFLMAEELRRAARLAVAGGVGRENEIWYGAPTFRQAKRVMWERLKATIPARWMSAAPSETTGSIRLVSGHVIRLVGLDRHDALRGSGLWFFGGDEWADCRPESWSQTIRPMLSASRGHALFVGTPKGFDHLHEAYLRGIDRTGSEYRSFLFTTLDGGNVPAGEVESARLLLDARTFRQEYNASFENYAGRVIYAFDRAHGIRRQDYDPSRPVHIGIDFNVNPMSATVWQEVGRVAYQIDEVVLPTSNTDEMADELLRRYASGQIGVSPSAIHVYPDPAGVQRRSSAGGRTDIGILRERGFTVRAMSKHPPVRERMNVINAWFESASGERLAFVDPRCRFSIEAYERLAYRAGTSEPDKQSGHDHLVDATGYYLYVRRCALDGRATAPLPFDMGR